MTAKILFFLSFFINFACLCTQSGEEITLAQRLCIFNRNLIRYDQDICKDLAAMQPKCVLGASLGTAAIGCATMLGYGIYRAMRRTSFLDYTHNAITSYRLFNLLYITLIASTAAAYAGYWFNKRRVIKKFQNQHEDLLREEASITSHFDSITRSRDAFAHMDPQNLFLQVPCSHARAENLRLRLIRET